MIKSSSLYFLFIQKIHIYKRTHAIKYMNIFKKETYYLHDIHTLLLFSKIKKHIKTEQPSKQTNKQINKEGYKC